MQVNLEGRLKCCFQLAMSYFQRGGGLDGSFFKLQLNQFISRCLCCFCRI